MNNLPARLYYQLGEAAQKLGCSTTDLLHWGSQHIIELMLKMPRYSINNEALALVCFCDKLKTVQKVDGSWGFEVIERKIYDSRLFALSHSPYLFLGVDARAIRALELNGEVFAIGGQKFYRQEEMELICCSTVEVVTSLTTTERFAPEELNYNDGVLELANWYFLKDNEVWLFDLTRSSQDFAATARFTTEDVFIAAKELERLKANSHNASKEILLKSTTEKTTPSEHSQPSAWKTEGSRIIDQKIKENPKIRYQDLECEVFNELVSRGYKNDRGRALTQATVQRHLMRGTKDQLIKTNKN